MRESESAFGYALEAFVAGLRLIGKAVNDVAMWLAGYK